MVSCNLKKLDSDGTSHFLTRINAHVVPNKDDIVRLNYGNPNDPDSIDADEYVVVRVVHNIYPNSHSISVIVKDAD